MWALDPRVSGGQGGNRTPTVERRLIYSQRSSPPAQPTHEQRCRTETAVSWWIRHLFMSAGADDGTRTRNRRFTKPLLYQLSYVGAQGHTAERPVAPADDRARPEHGQ